MNIVENFKKKTDVKLSSMEEKRFDSVEKAIIEDKKTLEMYEGLVKHLKENSVECELNPKLIKTYNKEIRDLRIKLINNEATVAKMVLA